MVKTVLNVFLFLIAIVGSWIWVGKTITNMTGGEVIPVKGAAAEVTPEAGEKLFFGKGTCYTCHAIGDKGSGVRCPNLGVMGDKFPIPIGPRAATIRAKTLQEQVKSAKPLTATDYLITRLTEPDIFVIEGYPTHVMPIIYKPPVALNTDEFKAVLVFLESQGGEPDMDGINNPSDYAKPIWEKIKAATGGGGAATAAAAAGGGAEVSGDAPLADIFEKATCPACHTIPGVPNAEGQIGPKLTVKTNWKDRQKDPNYKGHATTAREYAMEKIIFTNDFYTVPKFEPNVMPKDFGKKLDAKAISKIVDYISQLEEGKAPPPLLQ
jgi:cytochrome c553